MPPYRFRQAPPWWPEGEPWPPSRGARHWRRGRNRFVRRIAFVFALMLLLSALGFGSIVSLVFGERRVAGWPSHLLPLGVLLIAWPILLAVLAFAMRRVGSPLGDVVEAAAKVADGDYAVRVTEHGPPSLRIVGRAFNDMASRLEEQTRQRREMMADIAHELRTPLSVIQGRLEGLLDGVYPRDDAQLTQLLGDARVLARLIEDLRTLSQSDGGTLVLRTEQTDLGVLVQEAAETLAPQAESGRLVVNLDVAADLPLADVDPLRLREVLLNVMANAIQHTPAGGSISVHGRATDAGVTIVVEDTGPGIPGEDLPRVFDRFHKGPGSHGSGLGLTIARNLVTAHGGQIRAENRPGRGAMITIDVPLRLEGRP